MEGVFDVQKAEILINSIELAKEFVDVATKQDCDIDLTIAHYMVDGKSILGVFSLNLANVLTLIVHSDDKSVMEQFQKYIV